MSAIDTSPRNGIRDDGVVEKMESEASSPLSEPDDEMTTHPSFHHDSGKENEWTNGIKLEEDHATATTLRPDPLPSKKRRESEVNSTSPEALERPLNKKRKRGSSPPWTFPTAENTTLKTADGRRISARVNTSTPTLSESNDARGRSSSLSAPPPLGKPRIESPPWRKFAPQGPTSLVVDGQRKSGRVNKELSEPPKRVSPRSKDKERKRDEKPIHKASPSKHSVSGVSHVKSPSTSSAKKAGKERETRKPSESTSDAKIAELRAQINALKPTRSFPSPDNNHKRSHKRKSSNDVSQFTSHREPPSSPPATQRKHARQTSPESHFHRPSPKIKLRLHNTPRQPIPPPHPNAKFPPPVYPPRLSIFQSIDQYELKELQQPYTENERGPPDMPWFQQRAERQAVEEGAMRRRLLKEAEPGGMLSKEKLSIYQDVDAQAEPPRQYARHDHMVAHALYLRLLQQREKNSHKQLAKRVAQEALEFWKAKRGPTEEDLRAEQDKIFVLIYKQVVFDMKGKWELVRLHVQAKRQKEHEERMEKERRERLQEKLMWSENLVAKLRGEAGSEADDDDEDDDDGESDEDSSSGEENMSESSSEANDDDVPDAAGEMAEDELKAYLAQRQSEDEHPDHGSGGDASDSEEDITEDQAHEGAVQDDDTSMADLLDDQLNGHHDGDASMADGDDDAATPHDHFAGSQVEGDTNIDSTTIDLIIDDEDGDDEPDEEFDPSNGAVEDEDVEDETGTAHLLRRSGRSSPALDQKDEADFSSDESTDMDSTDYDSDEDMSETGDEDNAEDGDEDEEDDAVPQNSLASLFKDVIKPKAGGLPTPTTSAEGEDRDVTEASMVDRELEGEPTLKQDDSMEDVQDTQPAEQSPELVTAPTSPGTDSMDESTKHLIPSPSLLHGTLRSYQHTGVDWLASLYRNGTNGILADEMGLGKTIQTIALLAHLAEEHEVWDAHLVIVPTSVVLNWVAEFQKFLPGFRVLGYYGTAEERHHKRRGWINDPHNSDRTKRGYNVVITSYNVAMQDINAIRTVQWHYLVLDEAHNIRNFNSQRWQVLIRLKTTARLLLTGTPLQNSLTELWSLLTFLTAGDDDPQHGDLEEFLSHWKEPVKEIFDRGVSTLSSEAQRVVDQLHVSLRPFLLRRLKSEVEKDLPKKTESVVVCKLSKRQRQLYQDYMGLADTKKSLMRGNAVSAGKVLLSLRKVCNHPDLFDPRPIQTSYAMESCPAEEWAAKEKAVRRLLGGEREASKLFAITGHESQKKNAFVRAKKLDAKVKIEAQAKELEIQIAANSEPDVSTLDGCRALQKLRIRQEKLAHLRSCISTSGDSHQAVPIYGSDLREMLTIHRDRAYSVAVRDIRGRISGKSLRGWPALGRYPLRSEMDHRSDWLVATDTMLQRSVQTTDSYAERYQDTLVRFAFCTPAATAPILPYLIPARTQSDLRASLLYPAEADYASEARMRTSIVFPDSRLLIYDSGKLQRLNRLLRDLQSRGSRSLIFSQMTGTLDVLERFLGLLNLPYLRLDGSTPIERRQIYSAEFNRPDSKYQVMILSSRAGGIGLNLTGASSVIFYDLDWNPQMDRQCMDRAHRIGQVRDVEVYKMVSEKTVEENILKRADQKSLLDQAVIQEGNFTTEHMAPTHHFQPPSREDDGEDEDTVQAAIERFLGGASGNEKSTLAALESVEDKEDFQAAQQARKEEHQDDVDFVDRSSKAASVPPTPGGQRTPGGHIPGDDGDDGLRGHVDTYMINLVERWWRDVPFVPPVSIRRDRHGRDAHGRKRKR